MTLRINKDNTVQSSIILDITISYYVMFLGIRNTCEAPT